MKIKLPKFLKSKTSEIVSDAVSEELGGDCHIRLNEVEIGVKNKKAYFHFNAEGEMDIKDLIAVIKMANEGV